MKTYFVIRTENGRELEYWQFNTRLEAEDWIAVYTFDHQQYQIVEFQTTGSWTPV